MGLNGRALVMSVKEVFMDSQSKFAQSVHCSIGIFTKKTAVVFGKSYIQKPVHGLDFPMLPRKLH